MTQPLDSNRINSIAELEIKIAQLKLKDIEQSAEIDELLTKVEELKKERQAFEDNLVKIKKDLTTELLEFEVEIQSKIEKVVETYKKDCSEASGTDLTGKMTQLQSLLDFKASQLADMRRRVDGLRSFQFNKQTPNRKCVVFKNEIEPETWMFVKDEIDAHHGN